MIFSSGNEDYKAGKEKEGNSSALGLRLLLIPTDPTNPSPLPGIAVLLYLCGNGLLGKSVDSI